MGKKAKQFQTKSGHFTQLRLLIAVFLLATLVTGRFAVGIITSNEASSGPERNNTASQLPSEREATVELENQTILESVQVDISEELQKLVNDFNDKNDGYQAVYIRALDDSFEAAIDANHQMDSASLYKTLAAYKVLQRIDAGELSMQSRTSAGASLERCLELAIVISDNPCGIALQSLANPYDTDQQARAWGYTNTTLSGYYPQTSAYDQYQLFRDIYNGKRLSSDSHELLLTHLANQEITDRTPTYLEDTLYLKTGDLGGVVHSSALVETSTTVYTISVLTDEWPADLNAKYAAISDLHGEVHRVVTQSESTE